MVRQPSSPINLISVRLGFRTTVLSEYWVLGIPGRRVVRQLKRPKISKYRVVGLVGCRANGTLSNYGVSILLDYRTTGLLDYWDAK